MITCSPISSTSFIKKVIQVSVMAVGLLVVASASATIVQFQTNMGNFEVNLYDKGTPKTVENFLAYVKADAYKNSIVHRSVRDFVIQGGGYSFEGKLPLIAIMQNAPVINEPVYANKKGTISMAKLGGQPNSATNQWFINLTDNSSLLDKDNSGYSVFGEVSVSGMSVINAIAALNIIDTGVNPVREIPLIKYTQADSNANTLPTESNFVIIRNILILDANVGTADILTPVKTTHPATTSSAGASSAAASSAANTNSGSKSSGGGNIGLLGLLMLSGFSLLFINTPKQHGSLK